MNNDSNEIKNNENSQPNNKQNNSAITVLVIILIVCIVAAVIGAMLYIKFVKNDDDDSKNTEPKNVQVQNQEVNNTQITNTEVNNTQITNTEINNGISNTIVDPKLDSDSEIEKVKINKFYFETPSNFIVEYSMGSVILRTEDNTVRINFYDESTTNSFDIIKEKIKENPIPNQPEVTTESIDEGEYNGYKYLIVRLNDPADTANVHVGYYMDIDENVRIMGRSKCSNITISNEIEKIVLQVFSTVELNKVDLPNGTINYDESSIVDIGKEIKVDTQLYMTLEDVKIVNVSEIPEEVYRINKSRQDYELAILKLKFKNISNTSNIELLSNQIRCVTNNTPEDYVGSLAFIGDSSRKALYEHLGIDKLIFNEESKIKLLPGEEIEGYVVVNEYAKGTESYFYYGGSWETPLYKYKIK